MSRNAIRTITRTPPLSPGATLSMIRRRGQDFRNLRNDWASSALDRRLRFTFAPSYDFKPFANSTWLMKNIVGNWNITGSYTFQSPEYATVQSGIDSNLNNDTAGDR